MGVLSMLSALSASVALTIAAAEDTQYHPGNPDVNCESYIPIHKVFGQPNNNYVFSDDREIRADSYNVGGCTPYPQYHTGSVFTGNYTLMGHQADIADKNCLVEDDTYSSFQAIVIRSNGWLFDAEKIDLDDIDSQTFVQNKFLPLLLS